MSISKIIVGIITAIPTIYFFLVMSWGFNVTKQMNDFQSGKTDQLNISTPLTWLGDRKEYRQYFAMDELSRRRVVDVKIKSTMADILRKGEKMPDPALFELWATARAPAHLIEHCDLVLERLGTYCDVISYSARSDEEGNISFNGSLAYIPAYPLGSPEGVASGDFLSATTYLAERGELADDRDGRLEAMARAEEICGELRGVYGTCIIRNVDLKPAGRRTEGGLMATATFVVYADQTRHRMESVRGTLKQIMDARTALLTPSE